MKTNSWGKKATIDVGTALAVFALGCSNVGPPPAAGTAGPVAIAAREPVDFAFDSLDERLVTAEAARGKPTVLTFVTTSSLPGQAQVDFLVAMARHDANRVNYAVIVLEPRDARELVELYRKALAIPFPVAIADSQTFSGGGPFGDVRTVPVTLMLDRIGRVVFRVEGRVAKSDELRSALRGL